jgi:putative DNA primase/helicase
MNNYIQQFKHAMQASGLLPPAEIIDDGEMHRFSTNDKATDKSGWYVLHLDGQPRGSFGCWRSGIKSSWSGQSDSLALISQRQTQEAQIERKQQRQLQQSQLHENAKGIAHELLHQSPLATHHPYLIKKGIDAHGIRADGDRLLIPIRDSAGALQSMQTISTDGSKRFLFGGRVLGGYFSIGKPQKQLIVCEGFATGASIYQCTGLAVAVAFSAVNLEAVALVLHKKYPALDITIAADDDYNTPGNPGMAKAEAAAIAVQGSLAIPVFPPDRPDKATDFNDLHRLFGEEVVVQAIAAAKPCTPEKHNDEGVEEYALSVELLRASDVKPQPINWLWKDWLAAGKLHVLAGAPGTGKTTISISLAATISVGAVWPDRTRATAGNVVIWSGEDDPADTLIPRLALSGADLTRIHFINGVREANEHRSFDPARDTEPLRRKLAEIGNIRLLIVDPIVAAVLGDSHKNAEVRRGLQPLVDLAGSLGCALLGITHLSKGTQGRDPIERLTGSLAFGALARVVMLAAKKQEEGEDGHVGRIFLRAKSNIGPDDGGFVYDLQQGEPQGMAGVVSSAVSWGESIKGAARDLLAEAENNEDDEGGSVADAKQFLIDLLTDGPIPIKEIQADIKGAGYSQATIRRAKKALGIESVKEGGKYGGGKQQWVWTLPLPEGAQQKNHEHLQQVPLKVLTIAEDAQQNKVSTFSKFEHLQQNGGTVEVEI